MVAILDVTRLGMFGFYAVRTGKDMPMDAGATCISAQKLRVGCLCGMGFGRPAPLAAEQGLIVRAGGYVSHIHTGQSGQQIYHYHGWIK